MRNKGRDSGSTQGVKPGVQLTLGTFRAKVRGETNCALRDVL